MYGALEDNVVLCMVVCSGLACGVWDSSIGAYSDITSPRVEMVQIVGIKTMGDSKVKKGRCDEFVSYGYGALDAQRGFVSVGGCISNVRGMVGG